MQQHSNNTPTTLQQHSNNTPTQQFSNHALALAVRQCGVDLGMVGRGEGGTGEGGTVGGVVDFESVEGEGVAGVVDGRVFFPF